MPEGELWGELLDVLKDISSYMAKQDATQETAKIDKPPRISEEEDEITGGSAPSGKPGSGVAKAMAVDMPDLSDNPKEEIKSGGKTMLKAEDKDDEDDEDEKDEDEDDVEELKSLLKDIRSALLTKSSDVPNISTLVRSEIQKALPNTMERMIRKMGYQITKPDVIKLDLEKSGLDEDPSAIKKSADESGSSTDIKKALDEQNKRVMDMSKLSWTELGNMRAKTGDFDMFRSK